MCWGWQALVDHRRHIGADAVVVEEAFDRAKRRECNLTNRKENALSQEGCDE